jgi:hypothetical protein
MANRILLPAAVTVVEARGARWSILMWGVYGRERGTRRHYDPVHYPWPELVECRDRHKHD